jgi:hypothetical protein
MAYRILVYLHRLPDAEPEYLGEVEFDLRPVVGSSVSLSHKGKRETGQIETIAPPNWESLGVVPTVHIAQGQKPGKGPSLG